MLLYLEDKFYRSCKRVQYTYFIEYLSSFTTLSFPSFFSFSKTVKKKNVQSSRSNKFYTPRLRNIGSPSKAPWVFKREKIFPSRTIVTFLLHCRGRVRMKWRGTPLFLPGLLNFPQNAWKAPQTGNIESSFVPLK